MKLRAKLAVVLAAAIMAGSLSGCGSKGQDNTEAGSITTEAGNVTESDTKEATSQTETKTEEETEEEPEEEKTVEPYKGTYEVKDNGIPVVSLVIDESKGTIFDMNGDENHENKCYGSVEIMVPDGYSCEYTDSYTGGTYELDFMRGRGNSTWGENKKPYRLKFAHRENIFNMGSAKNYALLSNFYDATSIRNRITYELSQDIGMEYSIQGVNVDLYMNGKYVGVYYLCEMVEVDRARVNIDDLEDSYTEGMSETELSGGYLLGMHTEEDGHGKIIETSHHEFFNITSPKADEEGEYAEAEEYISKYMQEVEDALYNNLNPDQSTHNFTDYIDVDSAVKLYWMLEFTFNTDAYKTSSTYLYKKKDTVDADGNVIKGKLYYGPAWDYDVAYLGGNYISKWNISDSWARLMMMDEDFCKKVMDYWPTFKAEILKYAEDGGKIDKYYAENRASSIESITLYNGNQADMAEIEYDSAGPELKKYIIERCEWIDNNLNSIVPEVMTIHYICDGKEVYTGYGIVGASVGDGPEDPVSADKLFTGWSYEYYDDFYGEVVSTSLELGRDAPKLNTKELTVTATFE